MHQPRPGHRLKQRLHPFPPPEGKHHRRHRPRVQPHRTHIKQVAGNAVQFAQDDADVLGPFRYFQPHQLLNGHAVGQLVVEIADVVHPVEQRYHLVVLLALAQLLGAAMQIADVRLDINDFFAVHPQHHPKYAVGRGMLRPHIEQHLYGLGTGVAASAVAGGRYVNGWFNHNSSIV